MTKSWKKFACFLVVGFCCLFLSGISAKPIFYSMFGNFSSPPIRPSLKMHPLISRCFPLTGISIGIVLAPGTKPEVDAPIIKAVPVFVVNFLPFGGTHNNAVHIFKAGPAFSLWISSHIEVNATIVNMPLPFINQRSIFIGKKNRGISNTDLSHAPNLTTSLFVGKRYLI